MTVATDRLMNLEEYLCYDAEDGAVRVLENGRLVEIPPESDLNAAIAIALLAHFLQFIPPTRLRNKTEIAVTGYRTTTRIPDLTILTDDLAKALAERPSSIILPDMPPPLLVLEVVSPGRENELRDYRYKRSEYAARGIPEYWIVDPVAAKVTVLMLVAGLYEAQVFQGEAVVTSTLFPNFNLTVEQILHP